MKRLNGDVWMAVSIIAIASVYLWMASQLPTVRLADPLGPKAFPTLIGAGLILSALLLLLESRKKRRAEELPTPSVAQLEPAKSEEKRHLLILFGMIVWTAAYYTALEEVGYLASTIMFLFGLLSYFNRKRHKTNIAIAVIFTLVIDCLFTYVLGVPMPTGILSI